jgi:hypothetical protein
MVHLQLKRKIAMATVCHSNTNLLSEHVYFNTIENVLQDGFLLTKMKNHYQNRTLVDLGLLVFLLPKTVKLFRFQIF